MDKEKQSKKSKGVQKDRQGVEKDRQWGSKRQAIRRLKRQATL